MQKLFKLGWYNLLGQLNNLILPENQEAEPIKNGDNILEALAKLQAQVDELKKA